MHIVDVTLENAQQQLIDESFNRLVVVDFWADWCAPCKTLMPILEKLANEYQGAFLLAKVNADEQNRLAAQFGVRSLPTVMLIKEGQPLDGFTGAQSEKIIRELLEKYLPKPWEVDFQKAQAFVDQKLFSEALPLLRKAYADSNEQGKVGIRLAQVLFELNRIEECSATMNDVSFIDRDALYEQILAQLELKKQAAKTPEIAALEAARDQQPNNLDIIYQLALQLNQEGFAGQALEYLFLILQKDRNFSEGAAKKTMMDIIAVLGKSDPVAIQYQRKLFTLLY